MNKYIKSTFAAAAALTLASCSLDEYNPHSISTADEWSTAAGYEKKVNDCYFDLIRIIYGQAEDTYVMTAEAGTDLWQDVTPGGTNGNWSKIMRYQDWGPTSAGGMTWECYTGMHGALSACNAAIAYKDKVQGLSQDKINELVAEAYFIRAHALFTIVEHWGGKYLPLAPMESAEKKPQSSSVNDWYKAILSDLEFAMQYLPAKQAVLGHATKAAAYHLYAKACLTYATYTDGLGNCTALTDAESKEYLNKAKEAADYLINNAASLGVRLYGEASEVFDEYNNKSNDEAIFVVCHSTVQALNPRGNYYNRAWKHTEAYNNSDAGIYMECLTPSQDTEVNGMPVRRLAKGNCYMAPSKYMLDLYVDKDTRYGAFFNDVYYANKPTDKDGTTYTWTEGDAKRYNLDAKRVGNSDYNITLGDTAVYLPRKAWTQAQRDACRYAVYNVDDNYKDLAQPGRFFPSLKKNDTPHLYMHTNASKPFSAADCIIYRLGETYLLSAEIEWRLGNNDAAVARINTIRNRACEGHDGSLNITAAQLTKDFLLDEYAREMVGEWQRWTTLKRFRAFPERLQKANPQCAANWKDAYYLRPIATAEILLIENGDEYQNPGY